MSNIQDLRSRIRHFIQHPRRLRPYLAEKPVWNMLASSFDVIADTEMAVCTYEAMSEPEDRGYRYLTLYGVLQALYVQQDAVESMVWAFEPNAMPKYKIEFEREANEIRRIRNQAIGHPTKEGNVNSLKKPGVQMSHHIVQHSMHKSGFTILTGFANGGHVFTDVNLAKLIEKNRVMIYRVLDRIKSKLEAAEMEHRSKFKDERLADLFPRDARLLL